MKTYLVTAYVEALVVSEDKAAAWYLAKEALLGEIGSRLAAISDRERRTACRVTVKLANGLPEGWSSDDLCYPNDECDEEITAAEGLALNKQEGDLQ